MAGLNWPGLFAWSTKYHDGTAPSNFTVMSDEDRVFLQKAMEEAFGQVEDPNKVLQECISKIQVEGSTDEEIVTMLEVIDRLCDDTDVARNIEKLGGLRALLDLAREKGGSIRQRTLEILALLFSNNPQIQEAGAKHGALELFLKLTQDAPSNSEERSKSFRALVALVRLVPALEDAFLRTHGGLDLLVILLQATEETRTREKAASFALSAAVNGRLREEEVGKLAEAVSTLLPTLATGPLQYREMVSGCALELVRVAPAHCPAALADGARARLAELQSGAKEEGDNGAEEGALQECVNLLTSTST